MVYCACMQALQTIAGVIAADESRHEIAYTKIVDELFVRDPDGAMLAFAGTVPLPLSLMRCSTFLRKVEV